MIPGPPVGYTDLQDDALLEGQKDTAGVRDKSPLRPSSSGQCERALWYQYQEFIGARPVYPNVFDPKVSRLLDFGSTLEYHANKMMYKAADQFDLKLRYKQQTITCLTLSDGTVIEGSVDVCIESKFGKCVVDWKSQKDKFDAAFKTNWDWRLNKLSRSEYITTMSESCFFITDPLKFVDSLGDDYLVDNILQLNVYLCSPFFQERGYDHASIIKYNKNDHRQYELRFAPCLELAERIRIKFDNVLTAKTEQESKKSFYLGSIRCNFCNYKDVCWDEDATKAFFDTLPDKQWPTDIERLEKNLGIDLSSKFDAFEKILENNEKKIGVESELTSIMQENKIFKVKTKTGKVFKLKYLKSASNGYKSDHFELRPGK